MFLSVFIFHDVLLWITHIYNLHFNKLHHYKIVTHVCVCVSSARFESLSSLRQCKHLHDTKSLNDPNFLPLLQFFLPFLLLNLMTNGQPALVHFRHLLGWSVKQRRRSLRAHGKTRFHHSFFQPIKKRLQLSDTTFFSLS